MRAHLAQAARGAPERLGQALAVIQVFGFGGRRHDQVDVAVVEFIDEVDEAPRGIGVLDPETGDVAQDDRVVATRDLDVVAGRARPAAA